MQQLVKIAEHSQEHICWPLFMKGMCSEAWMDAKDTSYDKHYLLKQKRDTEWAGILVYEMLKFSISCWISQNEHVHRVMITEQNIKKWQKIEASEVKQVFTQPPELIANSPPLQHSH